MLFVRVLAALTNILIPFVDAEHLRVMTFNTWLWGVHVDDGARKIADQILIVQPDIVLLQEYLFPITSLSNLLGRLKNRYNGEVGGGIRSVSEIDGYRDVEEIFKREVVLVSKKYDVASGSKRREKNGFGVTVRIRHSRWPRVAHIHVWNVHLDSHHIGTDIFCSNENHELSDREKRKQAHDDEQLRLHEMQSILKTQRNDDMPTIMGGDLNSASHLDWTETTRKRNCGQTFRWPVTSAIARNGFVDSFRLVHPSPSLEPGFTWPTMKPQKPERLDFIFYRNRGSRVTLRPLASWTYAGVKKNLPKPNHDENDYPSDHYSVITDFELIF